MLFLIRATLAGSLIGAAMTAGIAYLPEERRSQGLILSFSTAQNLSFAALSKFTRLGFVDRAREVLEKRTFKDAVDEDWKLSRQYGITGVPTFVVGRHGVVGAQPYEALEQLVQKAAGEA